MTRSDSIKTSLSEHLIRTGCVKFGTFTLKSGIESPYYIDLREATMNPILFHETVEAVKAAITDDRKSRDWCQSNETNKTAIIGVPYGVVPIAAAVAYECKMVYYPVRKEVKAYGNKTDATRCDDHEFILIEDVMSSGSSIIETIKKLDGKKVTDVIVVVNRELGGEENLKCQYPDIRLHSILRVSELLKYKDQ